jgi:hypothetical protein
MGATKRRRTRKYSGGITFVGRFENDAQAKAMVGEIEKRLTLDLGLESAKGGIAATSKPICDCDDASECDERIGCLFVPWEDEPDPGDED